MRDLKCPKCGKGKFGYAHAKHNSSGSMSTKVRVCSNPECRQERVDTHVVEYPGMNKQTQSATSLPN